MRRLQMERFLWQDKVVVITGASSGIGADLARLLAPRGARLALAARRTTALESLLASLPLAAGQAVTVTTDVTSQDDIDHLFGQVLERWGRVDVLIANAGQYLRSPIQEVDLPFIQRSMDINFYGALRCVLAALPVMRQQGSGHIVFMSTVDALKPLPCDAPYVAAKSALSGFGEVLRQELHGTGIHATIVYPGRVDTPMIADLSVPSISAKISAEAVARATMRAVERRQVEVVVPSMARGLVYLNVFFPRLADWLARRLRLEGWSAEPTQPEKMYEK
jgi:uncharacterized protein